MNKTEKILMIIGGIAALALLIPGYTYKTYLLPFLKTWELFRPYPYWDQKQWSWGFGTKVPGSVNDEFIIPGGTITRDQAAAAMASHVETDLNYLRSLITVPLTPRQWAAWLSFSYNLGRYNADNLVNNINKQSWQELEDQWKLYINAGGSPSQHLIDRRNAEWNLFAG